MVVRQLHVNRNDELGITMHYTHAEAHEEKQDARSIKEKKKWERKKKER